MLSVSDISGSGYEGEPGSADRLWVPQHRLLKMLEGIAYDRLVKTTGDFSEVRRIDNAVVFFDSTNLDEDSGLSDDLYDAIADLDGCTLITSAWKPTEAKDIQVRELKILDECFCWCCLVGDDGPTSLETAVVEMVQWEEIADILRAKD